MDVATEDRIHENKSLFDTHKPRNYTCACMSPINTNTHIWLTIHSSPALLKGKKKKGGPTHHKESDIYSEFMNEKIKALRGRAFILL